MQALRDEWDSNVFRIAMYVEEGGYLNNPTGTTSKVEELIDAAIDLDMYVIIDWHILSDGNPQIHKADAKAFFDVISNKYKEYPNVIYEICNEPNYSSWENEIKPYAEEVIEVIRNNTEKSIIIVGTNSWSQDVEDPANDPIEDSRVIYSLHFYSGTHTEDLRNRATSVLDKIPLFVTEFGVSDASGNGGVYLDEAEKWMTWMNENNISWVNWSLSNKDETSALLIPDAPSNSIDDEYLSESGKFIKKSMKN